MLDDLELVPRRSTLPSGMAAASTARDLVFISYSQRDKPWKDKLLAVLKGYVRQGQLQVWADEYVEMGDDWRREIDAAIDRARVGVLLASTDFVASNFIMEVEVPKLLRAAEQGERVVTACAYSPDGACVLSASTDRTVREWDRTSGNEVRRFRGEERFAAACAYSPIGDRILSASEDILYEWDRASGATCRRFRGHS